MPLVTGATLVGSRVLLRPVQAGDRLDRQAHGWHASIQRNYADSRGDGPMSAQEADAWYERQVAQASDGSIHSWMIEAGGELVGATSLRDIRETDRKARFVIGLFAPRFLGRGLGGEATRLVLHHAFTTLRLHRVDLRVLACNETAIAAYRACGFVEEGRERDSCRLDGRWCDDLIMGILDHEVLTAR
jgi:RimJ/RimL family protein N-acetyltransferase